MSKVLICGGNGKISKLLVPLLKQKYSITSVIRDAAQSEAISFLGASPKVFSLEHSSLSEMELLVRDQDIVIWSAGAGGKGGAERTVAVDRDSAIRMVQACSKKRFVMVSALTSRKPDDIPEWWTPKDTEKFKNGYYSIQTYHEAKVAADEALMKSDNKWTIVRPGALTDSDPSGQVKAGKIDLEGKISRGNVAKFIAECMENEGTVSLNIDLLDGSEDIKAAIHRIASSKETTLLV